jgi:hypothetical protein
MSSSAMRPQALLSSVRATDPEIIYIFMDVPSPPISIIRQLPKYGFFSFPYKFILITDDSTVLDIT